MSRLGTMRLTSAHALSAAWILFNAAHLDAQRPLRGESAVLRDEPIGASAGDRSPGGASRIVEFTTSEGTWMSVDVSPDGTTLVFDLLGDLYRLPIEGGDAIRLTDGPAFDREPRFSPDGRTILFVSNRAGSEGLWLADADGAHARLVTEGAFRSPDWSPDGRHILATARDRQRDPRSGLRDGMITLYDRAGRTVSEVGRGTGGTFGPEGRVIYYSRPSSRRQSSLLSYDRTTGRTEVLSEGTRPLISPDGRWMVHGVTVGAAAALKVHDLAGAEDRWLLVDLPPLNHSDGSREPLPGAAFLPDGRSFVLSIRNQLWRIDFVTGQPTRIPFRAAVRQQLAPRMHAEVSASPSASTRLGAGRFVRHDIGLSLPHDTASGTLLLRGARVVTMRGREILEQADVVVAEGRIVSVGPRTRTPRGARVIDLSGKTILPGYIDLAVRTFSPPGGHGSRPWESLALLAYGVTTIREEAPASLDAFADRAQPGETLGPRSVIVRPEHPGADRDGAGMTELIPQLTRLIAGAPIVDRHVPLYPSGEDVVHLIARSGTIYVPALVAADHPTAGIPSTLGYYIVRGDYHADPKLGRFIPHHVLDDLTLIRRDGWAREERYPFPEYARDAARILAAGGRVAVASTGDLPGLGTHFELWSLAAGGMPPYDVLRAATRTGAEALGLASELGSIEAGKRADLQVLDGNPLEDIRATTKLRYVMKHGRLYEAETLHEVWPCSRALPTPRWPDDDPPLPPRRRLDLDRRSAQLP